MENKTNPIGGQGESKPPVAPVVTEKLKLDIFSIFGQSFEDFKVLWRGVLKFYLAIIGFLILSFLLLMIPVILLVGLKAFSAFNNGSVDFSGGLSGGATFIVAGIIFIAALFFIIILSLLAYCGLFLIIRDQRVDFKIIPLLKEARGYLGGYLWVNILSAFFVMVGFVLLFIPGLIFLVWFSLAGWVFFVEGIRGWSALKRSKELVSGFGWPTFWFLAIIVVLSGFISYFIGLFPQTVGSILSFFIQPLFGLFCLIALFNWYKKLKEIKKTA